MQFCEFLLHDPMIPKRPAKTKSPPAQNPAPIPSHPTKAI